MARARYGGPYTPATGPYAGVQFPSYYTYRTFQARLAGTPGGYPQARRERRAAAGKPPERRSKAAPAPRTLPPVVQKSAGMDTRYPSPYWQVGDETGAPLDRLALLALRNKLAELAYPSGARLQVAFYANIQSKGEREGWRHAIVTVGGFAGRLQAVIDAGPAGAAAPVELKRLVMGEPLPTWVKAIAFRPTGQGL
jgi:hypothetical protein